MKLLWKSLLLMIVFSSIGCRASSPAAKAPEGMKWIPAGTYSLGKGGQYGDELAPRKVTTPGFFISKTEVTNAEFLRFVEETKYVTYAERTPADENGKVFGSACCVSVESALTVTDRWKFVSGASWRHPLGPTSSIATHMSDPVVHITYEDALAYAKWANLDLPTENEWEIAARGGLVEQDYEWGNELNPSGKWRANTYQGDFPVKDLGLDGFEGLAPVKSFLSNGYGLYDMTGNVWELTKDSGPTEKESGAASHWAKGGSFLCAANYCARYRPAARIPITVETSTQHVGFRCVKRTAAP